MIDSGEKRPRLSDKELIAYAVNVSNGVYNDGHHVDYSAEVDYFEAIGRLTLEYEEARQTLINFIETYKHHLEDETND